MSLLKLEINQLKNISHAILEIPIEKGIYCLSGSNGCGKSTIMSCLAQLIFSHSLDRLKYENDTGDSYVKFCYKEKNDKWTLNGRTWHIDDFEGRLRFNGLYEGSLFYGTRFDDSLRIDDLVRNGSISTTDIVDADDYVKEKLSFILHDNIVHYSELKRIQNRKIAARIGLKNMPYFHMVNGKLISQYRMSSGECLLISLLHFIYNSLIRRSLPDTEPILMLVDEIELGLHPLAVARLIELLNEIMDRHDNITVLLTSHSPTLINKIDPNNMFMLEINSRKGLNIVNPCHPAYVIREIYTHDGFDYIILVEDILAKNIIECILDKLDLNCSKLIRVLPIGGWENVLKFQQEVYNSNLFGVGVHVFSVLDGDIEGQVGKQYRSLRKLFIPIGSIEKYLHKVLIEYQNDDVKKEINDRFFRVESVKGLLETYNTADDRNGKKLYNILKKNLEKHKISEDDFIKGVVKIIMKHEELDAFESGVKKIIETI